MTTTHDQPLEKEEVLEHYENTDRRSRSANSRGNRESVVPHNNGVVASEAVGGAYEEMPKGYYWSKGFLGTLAVSHSPSTTSMEHF